MFRVLQQAEAEAWLAELMLAAQTQYPGNLTLRDAVEEVINPAGFIPTAALGELLQELRTLTRSISPGEREKLREIMAAPSGTYTVQQLFPAFDRAPGNPDHATLRKLRDAQFIRPEEGGNWKRDKRIGIKPFGRLVWHYLGRSLLDPPSEPPSRAASNSSGEVEKPE